MRSVLHTKKGVALLEAVIGCSIFLIVITVSAQSFSRLLVFSLANTAYIQAAYLQEEGLEAVRVIRDNGWAQHIAPLVANQEYYLVFNMGTWVATTTAINIDGISRTFRLGNVNRDSNHNIVTGSGTLDANIKKVTLTVSWSSGGENKTKQLSTYITNVHGD